MRRCHHTCSIRRLQESIEHPTSWLRQLTWDNATSAYSREPDRPGLQLAKSGLRAKYPVILIPGFVTSGLELWNGLDCFEGVLSPPRAVPCLFGAVVCPAVACGPVSPCRCSVIDEHVVQLNAAPLLSSLFRRLKVKRHSARPTGNFRARVWTQASMARSFLRGRHCWMRHLSLNYTTGLDPEGIRIRNAQGLDAIDFFFPGVLYRGPDVVLAIFS